MTFFLADQFDHPLNNEIPKRHNQWLRYGLDRFEKVHRPDNRPDVHPLIPTLSSIEKKDVSINIKLSPNSNKTNFTIYRTHRAFEGEEFLCFLEDSILGNRGNLIKFIKELSPHAKKYISRYATIKELG